MRIAVGISGASGTIYGQRLVQCLARAGCEVILTCSPTLSKLCPAELDLPFDATKPDLDAFLGADVASKVRYHPPGDVGADVASGSYRLDAVAICPASTGYLGRLASGASTNLLERMGEVALKEGRRLVLVPRETPLSVITLRSMLTLAEAGAAILPASPGWYHQPKTLDDLVDFVVQKVVDRLGVDLELIRRWS